MSEGPTDPSLPAIHVQNGVVRENPRRYGGARLGHVSLHLDDDARIEVALPHEYTVLPGDEPGQLPFVLSVGFSASLYLERVALERLYAVVGHALEQTTREDPTP